MGYNTSYSLEIRSPDTDKALSDKDFVRLLVSGLRILSEEAEYCLDENGGTCEQGKWYGHEEDMRAFSRTYPHILFVLTGHGEGRGDGPDFWSEYFLNGKCQTARAVMAIPEFDRTKLK